VEAPFNQPEDRRSQQFEALRAKSLNCVPRFTHPSVGWHRQQGALWKVVSESAVHFIPEGRHAS